MTLPTLNLHAPGALAELFRRSRDLYGGYVMQADSTGDDADSSDPDAEEKNASDNSDEGGGDTGYPEKTAIKDMTDAQQAAYWKAQSRKWEGTAKARSDYDAIKTERDHLRESSMTPDEKQAQQAVEQAVQEALAQERAQVSSRIVHAELRGALAAKGMGADEISDLLQPLNPNYFLTESGEVDADKVANYADGIKPAGEPQWPDMGQGKRGAQKGRTTGADLHSKHYGKK